MRGRTLALLGLLSACSGPKQPDREPVDEDLVEVTPSWTARAIVLRDTEPGDDASDLAPLRPSFVDARVIAVGEATHASSEFFGLRERLLAWSIAELDVRALAIESSMAEVAVLDRYIQGEGSPGQAARLLARNSNWPWRVEEFARTVEWLRGYNHGRGPDQRVHLYGFDIQQPWATVAYLRDAFADRPELAAALADDDLLRVAVTPMAYAEWSPEQQSQTRAALTELGARIGAEPDHDPLDARIFATLIQVEDHYAQPGHRGVSPPRERAMAENIAWIADTLHPHAPIMVWAHNGHVSRVPLHPSHGDAMGRYLSEQFAERFVNLGFVFGQGSFLARNLELDDRPITELRLDSGPRGGLGPYLSGAGLPLFALDLRTLPREDPLRRWIAEPRRTWMVGSAVRDPEKQVGEFVLPDAFDLLVFVREVSASTPIDGSR